MSKKDPLRKCAVTGEIADRGTLLRFVLDPAGQVTFDMGKRLPGRGIWLIPRRDVLETARKWVKHVSILLMVHLVKPLEYKVDMLQATKQLLTLFVV